MGKSYIPVQYQAPTADSAVKVLELIARNLGTELGGPHKLGALVSLVVREIGEHIGSLSDEDRARWDTAVKMATHRLKDGSGCLEYHPPSAKGGHGIYVFKHVESPTDSDLPAEKAKSDFQKNAQAYVYAWCLPYYQREETFPVKVGKTERNPKERAVDSLTDLPEHPKVIMSIPCETVSDAEKTETIFHHVLRMRGRAIRDKHEVGKEWFRSSLAELREIVAFIYADQLEADFTD